MTSSDLSDIEHVRQRASMYIGNTGFFGLIHYLVYAVNDLLLRNPTHVSLTHKAGSFTLESDVDLMVEETESGDLYPFERFRKGDERVGYEAVVTALSETLDIEATCSGKRWKLKYERGHRCLLEVTEAKQPAGARLCFVPDGSIFTIESISLYNFHSYLKRISFLHPTVRFNLTSDGSTTTYCSRNGIRDMFEAVAAPYQLLHEPIHFRETEGELDLEFIFAFHSWTQDCCWSFINKGRAVEGGTHEEGLVDGLSDLREALKMPDATEPYRNGVVGIMSLSYPNVVWEGCIKAKIGEPTLRPAVQKLVASGSLDWLNEHPEVKQQLNDMQTFQFPDVWQR